ncbi:thiamine pyrophosphate-binding protein [Haliangium sp.]|uniref:thiamine pyrophosphate-binding protein n=1 Tax=Haliangium sp. TaxID=2663208 RepID=UPI003D145560
MNGGRRVAEVLVAQGVGHLFTLCGGHISPILVECKRQGIRISDVRHEVNAVFAADAMARLTGIPGVAAVTAGPGVTNTITAIKNARLAHSPVVLLGGATATMLRGRGALQDIDQMALMRPHVKWAARPRSVREIVPTLEKAFDIARRGVPGPVFVELAVDLLYDPAVVREWVAKKLDKPDKTLVEHAQSLYIRGHLAFLYTEPRPPRVRPPMPPPLTMATSEEIRQAADRVASARRPLMVLGSQTMRHPARAAALVEAIERIGVPVYLSGMARGLLGAEHPLLLRHKRRQALREADVVLLSGVPCDFRLDYGTHVARAHVIAVNLGNHDLTLNRKPDLGMIADPHTFLTDLARALPERPPGREAWMNTLRERETARADEIQAMASASVNPGEGTDGARGRLNPIALCQAIDAQLDDSDEAGSVLIGDGGDFVATAAYTLSPRGPYAWLDPGVFGTLGVGAGFALGAKLHRPKADVWLLYGDGAAGFSVIEFDTFVRHGAAVIAVVGNDAGWTQIERDQIEILGDDIGCRLAYTDYHRIAEACGGAGLLLEDPAETESVLARARDIARGGTPVLVNALIGKTDFRKGSISM